MAPEVIDGGKYSEKADIFSFGVLLVETYTCRPPYSEEEFQNVNQAQLMFKILHDGLRPPTDDLPPALVQLVRDCWNGQPSLRPSFSEIVIRLQRLDTIAPGSTERGHITPPSASLYTTLHELLPDENPTDDESTHLLD
jgi:hypothetical protein